MYEHEAQAIRDAENLAMLVDRHDYWLCFDYTNAVSDPDDPEAKKARMERKKNGIKPPPLPVLRPVAQRKPEIAAVIAEAYARQQLEAERPRTPDGKPISKLQLLRSSWAG